MAPVSIINKGRRASPLLGNGLRLPLRRRRDVAWGTGQGMQGGPASALAAQRVCHGGHRSGHWSGTGNANSSINLLQAGQHCCTPNGSAPPVEYCTIPIRPAQCQPSNLKAYRGNTGCSWPRGLSTSFCHTGIWHKYKFPSEFSNSFDSTSAFRALMVSTKRAPVMRTVALSVYIPEYSWSPLQEIGSSMVQWLILRLGGRMLLCRVPYLQCIPLAPAQACWRVPQEKASKT